MGGTPDSLGTNRFPELSSVVVNNTVDALNYAVLCQRAAFENLLSCYSTNEACSNKEFKQFRTWLTNSTCLYKELHLRQTTQLVSNLQTIFMMYETMDLQTFMEDIQTIAEEVKEMAKDAKLIAAIHVLLLEDLHLHQKNTRTTIDSLKVEAEFLRVEADKIKKETEEETMNSLKKGAYEVVTEVFGGAVVATTTTGCLMANSSVIAAAATGAMAVSAGGLVLVGAASIVGLGLGGAVLAAAGFTDAMATYKEGKEALSEGRARAFAAEEQEKLVRTASEMVQQLMNASESFMEAIEKVSGFFNQLEGHIVRCSQFVKSAQQRPSSSTDRQFELSTKRHFKMMKACSSKVLEACEGYTAYVPAAEAAVQALARLDKSNGSANYIEEWLKKRGLKLATAAEGDLTNLTNLKLLTISSDEG